MGCRSQWCRGDKGARLLLLEGPQNFLHRTFYDILTTPGGCQPDPALSHPIVPKPAPMGP